MTVDDTILEYKIECSYCALLAAPSKDRMREEADRMRELIGQRTAEFVADMERRKGLLRPASKACRD